MNPLNFFKKTDPEEKPTMSSMLSPDSVPASRLPMRQPGGPAPSVSPAVPHEDSELQLELDEVYLLLESIGEYPFNRVRRLARKLEKFIEELESSNSAGRP